MALVNRVFLALAAAFVMYALPADAQQTVVTNPADGTDIGAAFIGQSFVIGTSGTSYSNIRFSWLTPTNTNLAMGNLYLFSAAYNGTPNGLAAATANKLGMAASGGNVYTFSPTLTLSGGTQYFAYSDVSQDSGTNSNSYTAGNEYFTLQATSPFTVDNNNDNAFRITAAAVAPEPASWALMILGFGAAGVALRRRPSVTELRSLPAV